MKTIKKNDKAVGALSLVLFLFTFAAAQETDRNRVIIIGKPTATPTPRLIATPSPAPTATPVSTPTAVASVQNLRDLQSRINSILIRPALQRGQVGVKIVSLDTGRVLFENNAEKYFMPASNMKSFTVAAAMDRLTPNFRFITSVYANSPVDASGTVRGDLTIYGRGDPSFSIAFTYPDSTVPPTENDYVKGINALADKIVRSGVKKIDGNIVGDESYFNTDAIPSTWEWDDLQWYYGAEVSSLTINDNAVDLSIKPTNIDAPAAIQILPSNTLFTIINRTKTSAAGTKRDLQIVKKLGQNILEISGNIPAGDKGYTGYVAVSRPAMLFTSLLRKALEQRGVKVSGQTKVINASEKKAANLMPSLPPVEITKLESPPFSIVAAKTMKPSQNLYTELILRVLGEQAGDKTDPKKTSEQRGLEVIQQFLSEAGIPPGSVVQYDGCGLSRHDLITPAASARLYEFMTSRSYAQAWRDSLTIAGVDGTLKNRLTGPLTAGNVRGKTGTIDQVSSLSGYVTTASGEKLAFSVLTNNLPEGRLRTSTIDEIVTLLAGFGGKSNQ